MPPLAESLMTWIGTLQVARVNETARGTQPVPTRQAAGMSCCAMPPATPMSHRQVPRQPTVRRTQKLGLPVEEPPDALQTKELATAGTNATDPNTEQTTLRLQLIP